MGYLYPRSAGRRYYQQQWAIRQAKEARRARFEELKAKEKRMDQVLKMAELRPAHKVVMGVTPKDTGDKPWNRKLNASTLAKWALGVEDARAILEAQSWACVICERPFTRTPHIDHCHATGRRRSFLCHKCNPGLGQFCDDPALLRRAADYIDAHKATSIDEGLEALADAAIEVARNDTWED